VAGKSDLTMFVYPVNPSSGNVLRGRLKHSWLENEVRDKNVDDILALWERDSWPALSRFPAQLEDTLTLSQQLESGFSPVVLLDAWRESRDLSTQEDALWVQARERVHRYFLADSRACAVTVELAEPIRDAVKHMRDALGALLEAWGRPRNSENRQRLESCWRKFAARADTLYELICRIPKGVVIP